MCSFRAFESGGRGSRVSRQSADVIGMLSQLSGLWPRRAGTCSTALATLDVEAVPRSPPQRLGCCQATSQLCDAGSDGLVSGQLPKNCCLEPRVLPAQ